MMFSLTRIVFQNLQVASKLSHVHSYTNYDIIFWTHSINFVITCIQYSVLEVLGLVKLF